MNFLNEFSPKENASVIVVESVEKPGNLGAILRSCEAFGIDALIVTDTKVDFYNPNVLRSSVGCFFGMNVFSASNEETLAFLQKNNFKIYTTFMAKSTPLLWTKAPKIYTKRISLKNLPYFSGQNILV